MVLGGLVVIALFAALIGPWFINWDDYKANFEAEAEKILGQPVRVVGSAKASILPSPSLTFTNVEVGDTEGQPMMTVERFAVTIELMPLLQGEISVISMKLEKPVVRVSVDDTGQVDWFLRSAASRDLNPDSVVLSGVEITDGTLIYTDAGAGSTVALGDIRASVEARSLAGPWRIEGSYSEEGIPVQFTIATGRRLDGGSLRVKFDATPGHWPVAISTDGVIERTDNGPAYSGTYNATQIVVAEDGRAGDAAGWRSEGSFALTRDRLVVDKAVLSEGPPDRPSSLAGSMTVELGQDARFDATVQARQLDLDRSLGEGPSEPVEVGAAAESFVEWLAGIPVPPIPGRVRFNVPGIVVGGNVIRDVRFAAMPEDRGWQIEGLQARLPGQATFQADGRLSTGERVGFGGVVRLAVGQPATFASWWRGRSQDGAGRLLAPFDLSGRATVSLGGVAVEGMTTRIGNATITGGFSWAGETADAPGRKLRTDLQADRLDFGQIRALAELLGGRDLSDATALADSYTIKLSAGDLAIEDVAMRDVSIDAAFVDGGLTVSGIEVGDIGGASLKVTRGQIDDILTEPLGRMEAQLTAGTLTGLARVIDRIAPDTPFSRWFNQAAPSLSPASIGITIDSVMEDGEPNSRLDIKGSADATNFDASIELTGAPAVWRRGEARFTGSLSSYDAVGVARQLGLEPTDVSVGGARVSVSAAGVPNQGLETTLTGSFGGLTAESAGQLILPADLPGTYAGTFSVATDDLDPLIRMVGLSIPGAALGTPVRLAGDISGLGPAASLSWTNGEIAGRQVSGTVRVSEGADGGVTLDEGALQVDAVDAGWVASLGLGFAPLPTDNPDEPWSKTPFSEPVFGRLDAKLDIATEQLTVGNTLQVTNANLTLAVSPNRVDFDVMSGETSGGAVVGGFSIRNVGGNASVAGRLSMVGASLDSLIWQRAGRAVATGTVDISADFEATGRSPTGLISSLTGGGTLAVHDGEARYVNPRAANLVIRASDRGQQFDEEQLRDLFASYIDGGSLSFTETEAAFSIAAGTVRFQNMRVKADAAAASGSAAIDLNTMEIDSDWTLTLDAGDVDSDALPPQVGIVFRGPLSGPSRIFDVLQFNSYLNIRQEERIQQILILEEEARLEKDRLIRLRRKLREDVERVEREKEAARQARMTTAFNVEALHVARENHAEARAAAAHAAWLEVAVAEAEAKAAAEQVAAEAAEAAGAERQRAEEAMAAVEAKRDAVNDAGDAQQAATEELQRVEAMLAEANGVADDMQSAVEVATARLEATVESVEAATSALQAAEADLDAAEAAAVAAASRTEAALAEAETAAARADEARATAETVAAEASGLEAGSGTLAEAAAQVAEDLALAQADATVKVQVEAAAASKREETAAEAEASAEAAKQAEIAAATAEAERAAAQALAEQAAAGFAGTTDAAATAAAAAKAAETRLARARVTAAAADRLVEERRQALADLEDSDATLGGGLVFESREARIAAASEALQAAGDAAGEAGQRLVEVEAEVVQLVVEAKARAAAVDAARIAADKARADAAGKAEPARIARAAADEAKTAAAVAAATADAARTAAENAAEAAREAEAFAETVEERHQAAVDAAAAAGAEAGGAAEDAANARADADAAMTAAADARAAAVAAASEQETAEQLASDAAAARTVAADALAAAELSRTRAAEAADAAAARLVEAKDAVAAAEAVVEEKAGLEAEALKRASVALDDLHAAEAAAAEAAESAAAAETAAQDAAERAAALPDGWRPSDATDDRAEAVMERPVVTGAVVDLEPEPVVDIEPEPLVADLPVVEDAPLLAPLAESAPTPRLRPDRPAPRRTDPPPLADGPVLPTNDAPLIITPVIDN